MLMLLERNAIIGKNGWYEGREYCKVYDTESKKVSTILYYRYVWISVNGPIPEGMIIHHIDGDKNNNDISNLQLFTKEDHSRLHAYGFLPEIGASYSKSIYGKTYEEIYGEEKGTELRKSKCKTYEEKFGKDKACEISEKKSQSMKGKNTGPKSEETCKKISEANKCKLHTEEWKEKQSKRSKEMWKNEEYRNKVLAKPHEKISEETRKRMSEARIGKCWISEEAKEKMSEQNSKFIVIDLITGDIFNSLKAAERHYKRDAKYFKRHKELFKVERKI